MKFIRKTGFRGDHLAGFAHTKVRTRDTLLSDLAAGPDDGLSDCNHDCST